MKKILFFLESLAGGGAEKVLTDIVCHLDKTKYDITVCTVTDGDIYEKCIAPVCRYRSFLKTADYRAGGIKQVLFWARIKLIYGLPAKVVYKHFFRERYDIEIAFIEGFATKIIAVLLRNPEEMARLSDCCQQRDYTNAAEIGKLYALTEK